MLGSEPMLRRHDGATTVEFAIAAFLLVLPLSFATVELTLLLIARQQLTFATFMAARAGATTGGDYDVMQRELVRNLAPLYANHGIADAPAAAASHLSGAGRLHIQVTSPDSRSFLAWGKSTSSTREISNLMQVRDVGVTRLGVTFVEANVLAIESAICRPLLFPFTRSAFLAFASPGSANGFAAKCLAASEMPIVSSAAAPMQSNARSALLRVQVPP